jgi:hypothetical protein
MTHEPGPGRSHDRWAHLRFAVVGPLLAAPPPSSGNTWERPIEQAFRADAPQRFASDLSLGSSSSRNASPTRFTATTVSMMQNPGTDEIHHARSR